LKGAKLELENLLLRYTENHPLVKDQTAKVQRLQKQLNETRIGNAEPGAGAGAGDSLTTQKRYLQKQMEELESLRKGLKAKLGGLSEQGVTYARLKGRVQRLQSLHALLATRQREVRLLVDNGLTYYRIFTLADFGGV